MPDWTRGKQTRVCILLGLILCLTSSFLTFDWTQYYLGVVRISDEPSRRERRPCSQPGFSTHRRLPSLP